ncbi:hypothetical protein CARUB_v10003765mg [Capsella rubella]|uniref:Stress induced protein n=1 Tax=Capsella rubella TaxID=81985 RepID=R0H803_9BRAS|nr:uncharacterized protein LOC17882016 [Capsella rubella]EOA19718.1 hypothetical protein CARUB_v10003765mg [Capsella rubella]
MATDRENLLLSDDHEETAAFCGCGYFRKLCVVRWRRRRGGGDDDEEARLHHGHRGSLQEERGVVNWGIEKLKGLKEISEKIAGPKWKNFIRSFSHSRKKMRRDVDFTYDLKNYSLNFDDGGDGGGSQDPSPERFVAPLVIKV